MIGMPMRLSLALRLLAPYLAVGVFWCGMSNAWLAILAYHAQILFWARSYGADLWRPVPKRILPLVLPTALAGPVLYWLLPHITQTDLSAWLSNHGLSHMCMLAMIPYFGLVHPVLEQMHWAPLREQTPWAHLVFAGYHMLVLSSLLALPWLVVCFVILAAASVMWRELTRRCGLATPVLTHVLADLGVVMAAWLMA